MSDTSINTWVLIGLGIITMITVPILISHLSGKNITGYECGVHITPSGFSPYCKIEL